MAIPAHIRFGANALIGIALISAVGYWFMQTWPRDTIQQAIVGTGVDDRGIIARDPGTYFEGARRLKVQALLVENSTLDTRRNVELSVTFPFADLLRPGEDLPPANLLDLYAEARISDHLKDRCADWQAMVADRCAMTLAKIVDIKESHGGAMPVVQAVALYAITPRQVDTVEGNIDKMDFKQLRITFDMQAPKITVAERPAYLARAFETYEKVCAERRAEKGNCSFFWFKFRETHHGDTMNLTGDANLGWVVSPAAKS